MYIKILTHLAENANINISIQHTEIVWVRATETSVAKWIRMIGVLWSKGHFRKYSSCSSSCYGYHGILVKHNPAVDLISKDHMLDPAKGSKHFQGIISRLTILWVADHGKWCCRLPLNLLIKGRTLRILWDVKHSGSDHLSVVLPLPVMKRMLSKSLLLPSQQQQQQQ